MEVPDTSNASSPKVRGENGPCEDFDDILISVDVEGNNIDVRAEDPYVALGMNVWLAPLGGVHSSVRVSHCRLVDSTMTVW